MWHSYALRGATWLPHHVAAILADVGVDSFFAISGFLICRSWQRRPHLGRFALARARRILPGLWGCLLITAFLVAPVAALISGTSTPTASGQWRYVLSNAGVWVRCWGIDGGPVAVPRAGAWDGSLWSLGYEAACYLGVAILGCARLLRPRVVLTLALIFWSCSATLVAAGIGASGLPIWCAPRCGLMFSCGALAWLYREKIPVSKALGFLALCSVVAGALLLPSYRLLAAPAITYLCLVVALLLGRRPHFVFETDISYGTYVYGFVIQQALLLCGVSLGWAPFAALSTVVTLAAATVSWIVIERPALGRRRFPDAQRAIAPDILTT